jgi:hypothetical protein
MTGLALLASCLASVKDSRSLAPYMIYKSGRRLLLSRCEWGRPPVINNPAYHTYMTTDETRLSCDTYGCRECDPIIKWIPLVQQHLVKYGHMLR